MSDEQLAWTVFGSFVFVCMGLNLALDAAAHAKGAADWQRQLGGKEGTPPVALWAYRLGGAFFLLVGAAGFAGLALDPAALAARMRHASAGVAGNALGGMFFALGGALMGKAKFSEWLGERPLPGGLEAELPRPRPGLKRQLAFWSGWAVVGAFFVFGAYLLSRVVAAGRMG